METVKDKVSEYHIKAQEANNLYKRLVSSNATEKEQEEANIMRRFWKVMELEEGQQLGILLYDFAKFVDFDPILLKPIAEQDAGFWSDIEGMGFLEFQLNRLRFEKLRLQINLLQSIDFSLKKLVKHFTEEPSAEDLKETISDESSEKEEIDIDELLKN